MSLDVEESLKRKMNELSLHFFRKKVSPQTGFVHFYREDPFHPRQDPIATVENFLYAYSLIRSKLIENIQEGKGLLSKLLAFEVDGNFPVYLHEFPQTKDRQLSSHILPPLFYLLRDFSVALGEEMTKRLHLLAEKIVFFLNSQQDPLSKSAEARLMAFLGTFDPLSWTPKTPAEWGEFCLCSQMQGLDFSRALDVWNEDFSVFIGPGEPVQEGNAPALTFLDLFMGEYFQSFSKRVLAEHPVHARACLVQPCEKQEMIKTAQAYVSLMEEKQRQCLTLYWGGKESVHSFALEAKKGSWKILEKQDEFECLYLYEETLPGEDESVEFAFYLNDSSETSFKVAGEKATVFHPGDLVSIQSGFLEITVQVFTEDSQGRWMGHVLKGDRSFQIGRSRPYGGYDWKFGFRTIQRIPSSQAKVQIKIRHLS